MIKALLYCLMSLSLLTLGGTNLSTSEGFIEIGSIPHIGIHPFHISVTEILHKPKDKVIQMTIRLFQDDLEQGLREFTGNEDLDILKKEDAESLKEIIGKYVLQNLNLTTKKELSLNYLGFEYDNDVLYCYIESVKVKPFDQLTISNTILTSTYKDQENLVHVKKAGKVKSLRMTFTKRQETLDWDSKK